MATDPRVQLFAFDITLHRRCIGCGTDAPADRVYVDVWGEWPTLSVPRDELSLSMAIDFDEAFARLGRLERMYAEPDGSFVWTSGREGLSWQVDGNAFEKAGRVLLVDLKGSCPPQEFDRLLSCFGWPHETLMMQLVRPALFLEEAIFRQHALARGTAGDGETLRPR
ncbi:MAG: hypothetical protein WCQ91_08480 [Planctomycetota bacterium]